MPDRSAILFDLDGTLTRPALDFDAIRAEIGGVTGPILEAMERMTASQRRRAEKILIRHERHAAQRAELYDGARGVLEAIRRSGRKTAILTRNSRETVSYLVQRFELTLDAFRTREDGAIKPAAEPVLSLCQQLECHPGRSWMVGDFLFDILSGRAAGTRTILMVGDAPEPEFANQADYVIRRLEELLPIIGVTARI